MLAASLLLPVLLLAPADDEQGLRRSELSVRELAKMSDKVAAFFDALDVDDRAKQQEHLDALQKLADGNVRKARMEASPLVYLGDWEIVFQLAKSEPREFRSNAGKGFFRHVFTDVYDQDQRRVVSLLSLPATYSRESERLWPAVVGLRAPTGQRGADLEAAATAAANSLYADLMEDHVVLVPLGLEAGEGRKAETAETEGSWASPEQRYAFYTAFRVLLEQVRLARSRVVLDGWGAAGLDALRLATVSPSFFAGVVDRSGPEADDSVILGNLGQVPLLYVKGAEVASDPAWLTASGVEGLQVEVLEDEGAATAPSDEVRTRVAEWIRQRQADLVPSEVRMYTPDLASSAWLTATEINRRPTAVPSDADFPRFHGRIDKAANAIDIETVNVLELRVFLADGLLDLDRPVTIRVNGKERVKRTFSRNLRELLENRFFNNPGDYGLYTARVLVDDIPANVPVAAEEG